MENQFRIENGILIKYDGPGGNVTIPDGIRAIGAGAFLNHENLRSVVIPEGVEEISGDFFSETPLGAFSGCMQLAVVKLPESLSEIGCRAFYGCKSMRNITLPAGLKKIGNRAFENCENLKNIIIPDGVSEIDYGVFMGCTALREAAFPAGVTVMREYAFSGCVSLEKIDLPKGLKAIDFSAFQNCKNLRRIYIPDTVKEIGDYAFENCENLISAMIDKNVEKIGENAFNGCKNLTIRTSSESTAENYAQNHEIRVLTFEKLRDAAEDMRRKAYAPYSNFGVGAALECEDGTVYTGCNVENASYPAGICAERNAVFHAVSEGQTKYARMVIIGSGDQPCVPCGMCRQVIAEFAPDMEIICLGKNGWAKKFFMRDLLPESFGAGNLK